MSESSDPPTYDVIIVGAGVAGLAAAQQLCKNNRRVLVLEAADYIGGRVKTVHDWGTPIELGAEFIHGTNTVTADLARQIGLTLIPTRGDKKLVDATGRALSGQEKLIFDKLMIYVSTYGKKGVSISKIIDNNPITRNSTICQLVALNIADLEAGDADTLDSGAYSEMVLRLRNNGATQLLKSGYQHIIEHLVENLNVRLHSIVDYVDYSEATSVAVTLSSGEVFYAPKILVTVSIGVLQHETITFSPQLPKYKRDVIGKLGMGSAMKCIIRFKDPHNVTSLFNYADGNNGSLQTITCWWASGSDPRVLVGYCGGSRAASALALKEDRLMQKIVEDLSQLFGEDLHEQLVDYKIARWDKNPFTMGAYSNHPVGTSNADRKLLAKTIDNRIYWAGEACVTDGNYATVHGAIRSGYTAAEDILQNLLQ